MRQDKKAVCTIGLIAANIGIFALILLLGREGDAQFYVKYGAMYEPYVVQRHEYYRLATCMFLHFSLDHLLNNMVMLGALGWNLEPVMGKARFLLLYFFSGIGGNVISLLLHQMTGQYSVSAGASGAVFGLMGALLCLALRKRGRNTGLSRRGIVIMVVLSLYFGMVTTGVDNAAHIGGLACGFLGEMILELFRKKG